MLKIQELSFSFGSHEVIRNLSLNLHEGEMATLIGASGSGKTTLFRLLTGLLSPKQGTFSVAGQASPAAYQVAYMMQDDLLLPWRTVLENLTLVGELGKNPLPKETLRQEARFYLKETGLEQWENAYPDQLSGGMRQRVSLSRALMQKRPILLLDEPFASLDVGLREQMHSLLREIRTRHGTTILMVTHDFRDALSFSDRIFLLEHGKIDREWTLSPEIQKDPFQFQKIYNDIRSCFS